MSLQKAIRLCDSYTLNNDSKMKWLWGEGLLGEALLQLDEYRGTENYRNFLLQYCDYYMQNFPQIESSDTCAPALITYQMQKSYPKKNYDKLTNAVIDYIKNEPRVADGLVNHMGHNSVSKWYPQSIWVDSLMMFGYFASLYGKEYNDQELIDIARVQVQKFANYLQDDKTKLWYHSYWFKGGHHYPRSRIFWARGNAWVISALPKILDNLEDLGCEQERQQIIEILRTTSQAMLRWQNNDGSFGTILGKFGVYRESSATALVADGWLHAVRKGYLDEFYLTPAILAYKWLDKKAIVEKNGNIAMTKISNPTIPLPVAPYLGYVCIPRSKNWSYGVASYVWASIEYDKYLKHIK